MKIVIDIPKDVIESAKSSPNYYPTYHFEKIWRAIANGIPLDKIRAEIKTKYDSIPWRNNDYDDGWIEALEWVFDDVLDKYKAESEGKK